MTTDSQETERSQRGRSTFFRITGEMGRQFLAPIGEIAPEMVQLTTDFPFGDLVSRPQLGLREREIATIAALTALGYALPQLRLHINGALNVGVSQEEVVEVLMQMSAYAGFPAALNALMVAREVFAERDGKQKKAPPF